HIARIPRGQRNPARRLLGPLVAKKSSESIFLSWNFLGPLTRDPHVLKAAKITKGRIALLPFALVCPVGAFWHLVENRQKCRIQGWVFLHTTSMRVQLPKNRVAIVSSRTNRQRDRRRPSPHRCRQHIPQVSIRSAVNFVVAQKGNIPPVLAVRLCTDRLVNAPALAMHDALLR